MNYKSLLLISVMALNTIVFSQEKKTNPVANGQAILKVFANYNTNMGGNDQVEAHDAMELKRTYFGYQSKLSENYSMKVVMDVGNSSGKYTAYLKTAELKYKKNNLTLNIGLISTKQFKLQEKFWGYRYLQKSYQDQYGYNSSADLGLAASYKVNKMLYVDAIVQNGEGYKHVDPTGTYRGGLGATLKIKPITFRLYYDVSAKTDISRQNISAFLGYQFKNKFRIGGEYSYQMNNAFVEDHNMFGCSVYGTYIINKKFEVFARYDNSMSNEFEGETPRLEPQAWNANRDEKLAIVGLQFKPVSKVKISANYRYAQSAVEELDAINWFFINLEFKL